MTATTTIKAIFLGNFASTDIYEGDKNSENTGFLVGTVRDHTQLKVVTITVSDKDHDGVMEDDECNPYGDNITYNLGGGAVTNKTDGTFEANVKLTLADGSERTVKVVAFQQQNGDLFISDLFNHGTLDNLEISKVEIASIGGTNFSGWFTNQSTDNTTIKAPLVTKNGFVEGDNGDNLIDVNYTGDPEGDRVDANDAILPGDTGNMDVILAFDGNDTVLAGDAADEVYAGGGNDFVDGGAGNDTIYGDRDLAGSATTTTTTVRESFEWDLLSDPSGDGTPIDNGDHFTHATQDTGNVNVTFSKIAFVKTPTTTFATNDQKVHSITDDGAPVNPNSSLSSELNAHGESATYRWAFDAPVTNVSFRVNDIDYSSEVTIRAFDINGHLIPITTSTGSGISTFNRDGVAGNEQLESRSGNLHVNPADTDPKYSALVNIAGPVSRIEITHNQDNSLSTGNAGINVTDIYFDAVASGSVGGGIAGNDTLLGGAGDDVIFGDGGDDLIDGGEGNDSLMGGDGRDTILGGLGNDTIDGGDGDDVLDGGDGDDQIMGGDGKDTLLGGTGNDTLMGGTDDDVLDGGDGDDLIIGETGSDTILGGAGNDTIDGGTGEDIIFGGAGDDQINGGEDNDTIFGGAGNDTIIGGNGSDYLNGSDGRDLFIGGTAGDTIDGGSGGDDFDTLDLRGSAPHGGSLNVTITGPDLNGNGSDGFVTLRDADGNVTGTFQFSEIEEIIPCFTPGTLIATPKGERLVEELKIGDKVITRDNGLQEIRWIGAKPLTGLDFVKYPHMKPVLIKAGALGNGLPERDTLYSPNHRVLINNEKTALYFDEREVLVAAKHLVGAPGVHEVDVMGTTYIHFMFDHHEVVLSNGSWTESFQPGDMALKGVGDAQRNEIFDLFPELRTQNGVQDYQSARRSLKKHEARLLLK